MNEYEIVAIDDHRTIIIQADSFQNRNDAVFFFDELGSIIGMVPLLNILLVKKIQKDIKD